MIPLVIDASVWVAAADSTDTFYKVSRTFLLYLTQRQIEMIVPAFARLELACAIARRYRDPARGRRLSEELLRSPLLKEKSLDPDLLTLAILLGTEKKLRAADALYAAVSAQAKVPLVSWDEELLSRAGAMTPKDWLAANAE